MKADSPHQRLIVEAGRKAIPLDVSIELTHHCNFRCKHCYIPNFSAPDLLSTERVLTLLDELVAAGTLFLTLTGGELFLRKDWLVIARRARELGFALRLFTNGTLIDEAKADQIAPLSAVVEISLYGATEETYARVTARKGQMAKVHRAIDLLRERDVPLLLKAPLMSLNHHDYEAIRDYAASVGADFQVSPTIIAKKDGNQEPLALRVAPAELLPRLGGPSTGCLVDDGDDDPRSSGPLCAAANRYCNITSAGDVMACNILPGSDANIRDRDFLDVWRNSAWLNKIRAIRKSDLHTCKSCSKLSYCGRCHAQALVEDGDLYGPSSYAQERAAVLEELVATENESPLPVLQG
ncbi:MAG: radical SAM protein [Acidobacteriota bacterium]